MTFSDFGALRNATEITFNLLKVIMTRLVQVIQLGLLPYKSAMTVQQKWTRHLLDQVKTKSNTTNTLLVVEHPPVYTVGIRKEGYTVEDKERLESLGADFIHTNRGGLITYHGPGQLVVYPVLYLRDFNLGMREYVHQLEQTVIDVCAQFGVSAGVTPQTGVWVGENKIAAIGVHGSRFVTSHGVSINCCTDLSWYDHIVPCGITDKGVTSLSHELHTNVTVSQTIPVFLAMFKEVFKCELQEAKSDAVS